LILGYNSQNAYKGTQLKSPRGFGKKYFTLQSILAHCVNVTLHKQVTKIASLFNLCFKSSAEEEEDPPLDIQNSCLFLLQNPTLCSCVFTKIAKQSIKNAKKIKKSNCNCKYFSFRRSGIHPPKIIHNHQI
jgi:hypothetical protein